MERDDDGERFARLEAQSASMLSAFREELHGEHGVRRDTERLFAGVEGLRERMTVVEATVTAAATSLARASNELRDLATAAAVKAGVETERGKRTKWLAGVAATIVSAVALVVLLAAGRSIILGTPAARPDPEQTRAAVSEALRQLHVIAPTPTP